MLVLLVAASGYLFELTEGFDSLEGIGLLEENIGGWDIAASLAATGILDSYLDLISPTRILILCATWDTICYTTLVLMLRAALDNFLLRLQLSLVRATLNSCVATLTRALRAALYSLFCDFGFCLLLRAAAKLFLRALDNLFVHRLDLALGNLFVHRIGFLTWFWGASDDAGARLFFLFNFFDDKF